MQASEARSAHTVEMWTIGIVFALLTLMYRAPLMALIPMTTVFISVQVALSLLAILARAGHLTLFQGLEIYITILAYGAGVDYCLFLTARYKEELDQGAEPAEAVARSVAGVDSSPDWSASDGSFAWPCC